jgi:hypothetical protein
MAAQDNTRIVTTPPISGFHDITLNAGEFAQISTEQSFEIAGTGPILVGQYLTSQQSLGVDSFTGDPSFILAVPVEGYRDGIAGPNPGVSYTRRDETTFYGVIPGTMVDFDVDFWNDVRPPAATAQVFQARIVVVGNGVARLDERRVFIVVPPDGGEIII